jgi:hypothetical protein
MPSIEALLKARYAHKKFTVGLSAELRGKTYWTCVQSSSILGAEDRSFTFETPFWVGLNLYADWHISKTCTVYAEGNNLLGDVMPTYRWAFYREMGASFTVGVKVQF